MPAIEAFRAQLEALDNSVLSGMTATIVDRALEPAEGLSVGAGTTTTRCARSARPSSAGQIP
ncbi:hypothetical protein G7085_19835 [Tessaracoccus sp. HDW20]|uniref:hypothetical protein n=1 Tax=Tessaracoccus coleopterorum TaxID=2714950 RepID=UPI0018D43EAE|nr:hypothetical protein [Tessaracoccus coleopterorum]NHB86025.1 hypothetical protein [Tessaracoccus coleopterorum]